MLKKITDLDVVNRRVLVRIDLNLPRKDGKISDYTRIERSIKTIKYLSDRGAKVIIISHLGRPKGKYSMELSLAPIADEIEKYLGKKVKFASDIFSSNLVTKTNLMEAGSIMLLENLRFYEGEEKNSPEFVSRLLELGDLYVNDTFSCSHRKHASIYGIAKKLPSAAGFLLVEELSNIEKILQYPKKPVLAIIGGSKISTKLQLLKTLINKIDYLVIGGAMANSFLHAKNIYIGTSIYEADLSLESLETLELAKDSQCEIILPKDFIVSEYLNTHADSKIVNINETFTGGIYDIGPKTLDLIGDLIEKSSTIIWNGPVGAFEIEPFDISTRQIARLIASATKYNNKISIAGGGDTLAAIKSAGLLSSFSYISTGGGAFLEWLEGRELHGIKVLESSNE